MEDVKRWVDLTEDDDPPPPQCKAILKTGPRAGDACGARTQHGSSYCRRSSHQVQSQISSSCIPRLTPSPSTRRLTDCDSPRPSLQSYTEDFVGETYTTTAPKDKPRNLTYKTHYNGKDNRRASSLLNEHAAWATKGFAGPASRLGTPTLMDLDPMAVYGSSLLKPRPSMNQEKARASGYRVQVPSPSAAGLANLKQNPLASHLILSSEAEVPTGGGDVGLISETALRQRLSPSPDEQYGSSPRRGHSTDVSAIAALTKLLRDYLVIDSCGKAGSGSSLKFADVDEGWEWELRVRRSQPQQADQQGTADDQLNVHMNNQHESAELELLKVSSTSRASPSPTMSSLKSSSCKTSYPFYPTSPLASPPQRSATPRPLPPMLSEHTRSIRRSNPLFVSSDEEEHDACSPRTGTKATGIHSVRKGNSVDVRASWEDGAPYSWQSTGDCSGGETEDGDQDRYADAEDDDDWVE